MIVKLWAAKELCLALVCKEETVGLSSSLELGRW